MPSNVLSPIWIDSTRHAIERLGDSYMNRIGSEVAGSRLVAPLRVFPTIW
jgi:hypothetical protein